MIELMEQIIERIKKLQEEPTDVNIGKVSELNLIAIRLHQLISPSVVGRLPNFEETKIEMEKELNNLNKNFGLSSLTRQEKRTYKSGFIACFLFMKGEK